MRPPEKFICSLNHVRLMRKKNKCQPDTKPIHVSVWVRGPSNKQKVLTEIPCKALKKQVHIDAITCSLENKHNLFILSFYDYKISKKLWKRLSSVHGNFFFLFRKSTYKSNANIEQCYLNLCILSYQCSIATGTVRIFSMDRRTEFAFSYLHVVMELHQTNNR